MLDAEHSSGSNPPSFCPIERGFFRARDNTPIYYESSGTGRPLLFCYGLTCRRAHWRCQISHFQSGYRILTLDYRGHHASGMPSNDRHLTLEWCARDIEDLLKFLGLDEVVVLGHSLGVAVLAYAAQFLGPRMKGAVFVCGSINNPFDHMFYTNKLNSLYRISSLLFDRFPTVSATAWKLFTGRNPLSYFLTSQFGFNPDRAEESDIVGYMEGVHRTPLKVFHALLKDYVSTNRLHLLESMRCPTLVVAGEDDCITPLSVQRTIVDHLPKGKLATVAEGSHNAHLDFPDEVNHHIEEFLWEIGYR